MLIGTAGHIDHGKTTLLRALTGIDADRLPEEKQRGITIELGYAYAPTADGQHLLAFIDVPGHEKFVPTMLTGAAGIDYALLVVAADDGVMPQTREHLAILSLLGITRGVVALTKCDRVTGDRIAEVTRQVAALLAPTTLRGSDCMAVSSITGEGIAALRARLDQVAMGEPPRLPVGGARLCIDRRFAVAGAGTVVTGTLLAGRLRVGDPLTLARGDGTLHAVRVRGLHVSNRPADEGLAGSRCAVNLAGIEHHAVARGDWLCAPGLAQPTDRLDLRVTWLPDAPRALTHWQGLHLHHAGGQVQARLALLDAHLESGGVPPGGHALVQAVLDEPILACWGDRIVLRDAAGRRTLGGARVLDTAPPVRHRRHQDRIRLLQALEHDDPAVRLAALLDSAPLGIAASALARAHNADVAAWKASLASRALIAVPGPGGGEHWFAPARWNDLGERIRTRLAAHHRQFDDEPGVERDRLRRMVAPALAPTVFLARLEAMREQGELDRAGAAWHLPGHSAELSDGDRVRAERLLPWLLDRAVDPPWVRDLARQLEHPEPDTRLLMRRLATRGEVFQVVRDLYYARAAVRDMARLAEAIAADGDRRVRASDFRDQLGIGRKRAIQILEFFDRVGFTRRVGDGADRAHVIRGDAPVVGD
ncbi:MAG: selenocysteine-specific translation elongation factor [Rhodocyclaceae bacterium]|nr:selenocysteine-specific translation elongation factor [Rhodocyclaceae bacterium]